MTDTHTLLDPGDIAQRIRGVIPASEERVALYEPRFMGNEKKYVGDCVDSTWVSYAGAYVKDFEVELATKCGVAHAVAVTSGTVALQVALTLIGVKSGDEVLVPSLTFVASANAIVHAGGTPHFVDADEISLGISPDALAAHLERVGEMRGGALHNRPTGKRIAALMPVHVFGHPADMDALNAIAKRYALAVVEDATEALGSSYKGRPCGALSPIATLSYNGNKIVTTGGGGAILTSDDAIAARIRHITTTAKLPHRWKFDHDEIAWNFRLPNVNAALGVAQLERLEQVLEAKRRLHARYADAFANVPGLRIFSDAPFARSNYWLVTLLLERGQEALLEPILAATNDSGISTRPAWTPMHQLPMYKDNPRAPLPVTESLAGRIVNLPSSPFLA